MNTTSNIGPRYPKLVKEFIINIPKKFNDDESKDFRKVCVRDFYFRFSPDILMSTLGEVSLSLKI